MKEYLDKNGLTRYNEKINEKIDKKVNRQDLLNIIYPVGSIYVSMNSTSPATLFGGTWEQIKDQFLYCTTTSKTTGGANSVSYKPSGSVSVSGSVANHTLTVDEMP